MVRAPFGFELLCSNNFHFFCCITVGIAVFLIYRLLNLLLLLLIHLVSFKWINVEIIPVPLNEQSIGFSGYGANGAVIHYKPTSDSCSFVGTDNLFLLDSGGQYVDGTTDITRTVHFGEPSAWQKECFTRVLQVLFLSEALLYIFWPPFI